MDSSGSTFKLSMQGHVNFAVFLRVGGLNMLDRDNIFKKKC
jgi:hypothetical protein